MKILVLITDGFGGHGGIALYNRYLLQGLSAHPVITRIVAVPRIQPDYDEPMPKKVDYRPVAGGKIGYVLGLLGTAFKQNRSDLLICGHINLFPIAALFAKFQRLPVMLILHGVEGWSRPAGLFKDWMLSTLASVVCVSSVTRERFLAWSRLSPKKVRTVRNGLDLAHFSPGVKPKSLLNRYGLDNKKVLLTVGRIDQSEQAKGFDEVLNVLPRLRQKYPDLVYLIVGDGSDAHRLKKRVRSLGLSGAVIFAGRIPDDEKADHYRVADAYVMPSRWEGFGYVYLEALACGLPVVGSSIDGSRDALDNGRLGRLVDPDQPDELYGAVLWVLQQPKHVPAGLEYYRVERFQSEMRDVVDELQTG